MCAFLNNYLDYKASPFNFKACQVLGTWKDCVSPAAIIKLLYFREKEEFFKQKLWLARRLIPQNRRIFFIKEQLSET